MARIRKYLLSWAPSDSQQLSGYRLYWSRGTTVDYDSDFIDIGKVNRIPLPDAIRDATISGGPVMLGVSAVDKFGNESDIIPLAEPYQISPPPPPKAFSLTLLDAFDDVHARQVPPAPPHAVENVEKVSIVEPPRKKKSLTGLRPPDRRIKYYDDVGFRKLNLKKQRKK